MKRYFSLLAVIGLLGIVIGHGMLSARAAGDTASERTRQFRNNQKLLKKLVQSSLELANEPDYSRRVEHCGKIAEYVAIEMSQAAQRKDGARAADLGRHLALLERGLATNLNKLSTQPAKDDHIPAVEKYMRGVQEAVKPVEDQLQNSRDLSHEKAVKSAMDDVLKGRQAVKDAVEDTVKRRKPRGKPDKR